MHETPTSAPLEGARSSRVEDLLRSWGQSVVDAYRGRLTRCFKGQHQRAPEWLEQVRHLLHGARGERTDVRRRRFDALQRIQQSQFPTVLIQDIAVLWWTAALFEPEKLLAPGRPPWDVP